MTEFKRFYLESFDKLPESFVDEEQLIDKIIEEEKRVVANDDLIEKEDGVKVILSESLAKLKAQAFEEGYKKATEEYDQQKFQLIEKQSDLISRMQQAVAELRGELTTQTRDKANEIVEYAFILGGKIAGKALEMYPQDSLKETLIEAIMKLIGELGLEVHIHSSNKEIVEVAFSDEIRNSSLIIVPDESLQLTDAKICWKGGSLEINKKSLIERIEKELGKF